MRAESAKFGGEDPLGDEDLLLCGAKLADAVLGREGLALGGEGPCREGRDGAAGAGVLRPLAGVVLGEAAREIGGVAGVEGAVGAAQEVDQVHPCSLARRGGGIKPRRDQWRPVERMLI
jgi:hypothetical protein